MLAPERAQSPQHCFEWKAATVVSFPYALNLSAARALALAASSSRFLGGALVSSKCRNRAETPATSSTAARNAASLAFDGLVNPLIFLTNCNDAARISSSVTGGSKLKSVLMFRHMAGSRKYSNLEGAPPLAPFLRQGGDFDFEWRPLRKWQDHLRSDHALGHDNRFDAEPFHRHKTHDSKRDQHP